MSLGFGEALLYLYPDISHLPDRAKIVNEVVLHAFGFEPHENKIMRDLRKSPWPEIRSFCWLLCKDLFGASFSGIARVYRRNHASVIYGVRNLEERIKNDDSIRAVYEKMKVEIQTQIKEV